MAFSAKKELKIIAALFAGLVTYALIDIVYLVTKGAEIPLHGIATPGGAPLSIHLFNTALNGFWSAAIYALVLKVSFGRVFPFRVVCVWALGLATIAAGVNCVELGLLAWPITSNLILALYFALGWLVIRDWPSRLKVAKPSPRSKTFNGQPALSSV
jgi:hypothetical protein